MGWEVYALKTTKRFIKKRKLLQPRLYIIETHANLTYANTYRQYVCENQDLFHISWLK